MKKRLFAILLCAGMTIAACSNTGTTTTTTQPAGSGTTVAEKPAGGGKDADQKYKSFSNAEPTTFDSAKASDNYAITVIMATQEPLVLIKGGEGGTIEFVGGGAEKWDVSADGKTYTFKLRENKWSDGKKVTAFDYEYGIKRAIDPATGSPYSYLLNPILNAKDANAKKKKMEEVGVKAIDENTLEIKLADATPHFIGVCGNSVTMPVRKDMVEKFADKYGSEANTVLYSGSHMVKEWVHNSKITLERNKNYWDNANVSFTEVNMPIISDTNTLMSSMETNEIDAVNTNLGEWQQRFKSNPKITHKVIENPQTFFMVFNTKDKVLSNVKIRRALTAAVDRKDMNEVIWYGNNIPARGWIPGNIFVGTDSYKDKTEDLIGKLKTEVGDPKAMLVEGLKELGMDQDPTKLIINITLGNTDQWFKTFGEYLQQKFKETLGITLNVEQMEWTVFADKVQKGNYQIGYMGWGSELVEPVALLALNLTDSNSLGSGWSNTKFDEIMNKAQIETDAAKRIKLYQEAESILIAEAPISPIVHSVSNRFTYKYVQGVDLNPFSNTGFRQGFISGR